MKTIRAIIGMAFILLLFSLQAWAQFVPEQIAKSLVQLTITGGDKGKAAASGFIWKEKKYLVTSLHAMRKGDDVNVKVKWSGSPVSWKANVVKINKDADLALLEIEPGDIGLPDWEPMHEVHTEKLPYQAVIHAFGYNSGAKNWSSRRLYKGAGQSDKLKDLIPSKDVAAIKKLGMPSAELDVLYLEGSLLPGFSGAPIVNEKGVLVGISDGGLENGASNVSWGIPAKNLEALMESEETELPDNMGHVDQVFSAEIDAPEDSKSIDFGEFHFEHTKTRTLSQMLSTADDPQAIQNEIESFREMGGNVETISFDVYEDLNYGVIICVPSGGKLVKEDDVLSVTYDDYTYISYVVFRDDSGSGSLTYDDLEELEQELVGGFTDFYPTVEDEKIVQTNVGELATFEISLSESEESEVPIMYFLAKIAISDNVGLMSVAFIGDVNEQNLLEINDCQLAGNSCADGRPMEGCENTCQLLEKWLATVSSVSLTTFANSWIVE